MDSASAALHALIPASDVPEISPLIGAGGFGSPGFTLNGHGPRATWRLETMSRSRANAAAAAISGQGDSIELLRNKWE